MIGSDEVGKQTTFNAITGFPPIAYTSLKAFAAAISPNFTGSSTTGVIISTVSIPTRDSSIFQVAASSPLLHDEIRDESFTTGRFLKIWSSSAGPILAAQPLVCASSVSLMFFPPSILFASVLCLQQRITYLCHLF